MSIDKTIEAIKALPSGMIYSDNDGLDPLAVFPTTLRAEELQNVAAYTERLETALRQFFEKLDQRSEQYKNDDVRVSPLWFTEMVLRDDIKSLRAALDSKGKEKG